MVKCKACDEEIEYDFDYSKNITVKNKYDYVPKIYTINFWHDFDDPRNYIPYFKILQEAHEEDQIIFYFDSPGGRVDTLNLFLNALRRCKSKYILARVNYAASAAALLALYCDNIEFNTNSTLMLHTYSGGYRGKSQEVKSEIEHYNKNYDELNKYILQKILTEEEIQQLLDGKDFYFTGSEAVKRLKDRASEKLKQEKLKKKKANGTK